MKKKFTPEDFLTRSDRAKQMIIPENSDKRVIVSCNNEAMGFKFNCYDADRLKQHVDKSVFDATVKEANKICENIWRQKKVQESEDFFTPIKRHLFWAFLFTGLAFFLFILLIYDNSNMVFLYSSIILISISASITMIVVIRSLFTKPTFIDMQFEIIKKLNEYLERQNKDYYNKKGLKWILEPHFYWLELQILNKRN